MANEPTGSTHVDGCSGNWYRVTLGGVEWCHRSDCPRCRAISAIHNDEVVYDPEDLLLVALMFAAPTHEKRGATDEPDAGEIFD